MSKFLNVMSSTLASSVSLWRGTSIKHGAIQPQQLLELYEFENCPYCRLVREALTALNIDAMIYPCPKGGERYRNVVLQLGGKAQFPYLLDPNTQQSLYESKDIVFYLYATYGNGLTPPMLPAVQLAGSFATSTARLGKGNNKRESVLPDKPLELYSFESSPFSRPVRELLCELELPYILRSTGKDQLKDMGPPELRTKLFPDEPVTGRNRVKMFKQAGKVQVPYLIDPNTEVEMFESEDIQAYLFNTYGL